MRFGWRADLLAQFVDHSQPHSHDAESAQMMLCDVRGSCHTTATRAKHQLADMITDSCNAQVQRHQHSQLLGCTMLLSTQVGAPQSITAYSHSGMSSQPCAYAATVPIAMILSFSKRSLPGLAHCVAALQQHR